MPAPETPKPPVIRAEDESESALAKEILEPRDAQFAGGHEGQKPILNLLAGLLIVAGIVVLIFLYYFYFQGK